MRDVGEWDVCHHLPKQTVSFLDIWDIFVGRTSSKAHTASSRVLSRVKFLLNTVVCN